MPFFVSPMFITDIAIKLKHNTAASPSLMRPPLSHNSHAITDTAASTARFSIFVFRSKCGIFSNSSIVETFPTTALKKSISTSETASKISNTPP